MGRACTKEIPDRARSAFDTAAGLSDDLRECLDFIIQESLPATALRKARLYSGKWWHHFITRRMRMLLRKTPKGTAFVRQPRCSDDQFATPSDLTQLISHALVMTEATFDLGHGEVVTRAEARAAEKLPKPSCIRGSGGRSRNSALDLQDERRFGMGLQIELRPVGVVDVLAVDVKRNGDRVGVVLHPMNHAARNRHDVP